MNDTTSKAKISSVTVVGGGTAGWIAAAVLQHFLNEDESKPKVRVELIESPDIPTVGVGEATVPGMPGLLAALGINEARFFERCNASFKLGVRFRNWSLDKQGNYIDFLNPFNFAEELNGINPAYHFLKFGPPAPGMDFAACMVPNPAVIRSWKGPRTKEHADFDFAIGYAYHLDAGRFAEFLREIAIERGVSHRLDDVVGSEQDEEGNITALTLKRGGRHEIEFLVDCTGFRAVFIEQTLKEPFISYNNHLLSDRALAVQLPHPDPSKLEPCTRSTALGAGWSWRVPLFTRIGTGYVFSSSHRSDEQARDEFVGLLKAQGEWVEGSEPRAIGMRVGRSRRTWAKNCVAMGLSGGFIEPLESTAIFMIDRTARWLARHFPHDGLSDKGRDAFNAEMEALYEEVRDFICLHYITSNRPDPYWLDARQGIDIPDRLLANMEIWKHRLPEPEDLNTAHLFTHWAYIFVLQARGYFKDMPLPAELAPRVTHEDWMRYCNAIALSKREMVQHFPSHYELVTSIRERAFALEDGAAAQDQTLGKDEVGLA